MRSVYLDHAATTPLDPRVFEAMLPFLKEHFGNASSVHGLGRKARHAVEESRERVAARLGAAPGEITFMSGATEANNAALKGGVRVGRPGLATSTAEHEAVLRPAETLQRLGHPVTFLQPGAHGAVGAMQVEAALGSEVGLVSLMHANNEVGTMTPMRDVAARCRARGVLVHCDAVQTAGLLAFTVDDLDVDLLSLSAHKLYGPKGVGVLFVRGGIDLPPLVEGGAQERRRRGGTENVAAIAGLARALDLAYEEAAYRRAHVTALRDRLYQSLRQALGEAFVLNTPLGQETEVVPHIVNIAFPPSNGQPFDGEMLLLGLDMEGVCASAGSACTSGALTPSHVLLAIGRDRPTASAAVRFSIGKDNNEEDVDYAVDRLRKVVVRMQKAGAAVPAIASK